MMMTIMVLLVGLAAAAPGASAQGNTTLEAWK